jgi:long-subunit fatty acid transport protein
LTLLAGCLLAAPTLGRAQNTNDVNAGIQFDFSLPGARSLAMGGAFVAVADDATAAYSNPAGLIVLSRPELSAEGRAWGFTTSSLSSGHAFGLPSRLGIDTVAGVERRSFDSDASGPSFFSFVYPRGRWAVAVFAHQLTRFNTRKQIQGPFFSCSGGYRGTNPQPPFCELDARAAGVDREFPKQQNMDLNIRSAGASVAYRIGDRLSLGVSGLVYGFEIDSRNRVFAARDELHYSEPSFAFPENLELEATQAGTDRAFAFTLGLLWQASNRLSFGASYRQGPRFNFEMTTTIGDAHPCVGAKWTRWPDACAERLEPGLVAAWDGENPFKVPDTWAVGLAFRPVETLTLSFEYDRTQFSQLIDELGDPARPSPQESEAVLQRIELDDSNRFRFGLEYLKLFKKRILALQLGAWYDPEHQMRFEADDPETGYPAPRWAVLFPRGENAWHLTAGVGFVFSEHLQLDSAFDWSDPTRTVSVSVVVMK